MGRILHWFYCLPMDRAALLLLLAAGLFRRIKARWGKRRGFAPVCGALFAAWLAAMAYTTLGNRETGTFTVSRDLFHSYRQWLAGGNVEILRSNFMNGALFFPGGVLLGALLPRRWPVWVRVLLGTAALGLLSAGVEYLQLAHSLGRVEIDDVLHNTLGAFLGLLMLTQKPRRGK